jgi:hypothetical protein
MADALPAPAPILIGSMVDAPCGALFTSVSNHRIPNTPATAHVHPPANFTTLKDVVSTRRTEMMAKDLLDCKRRDHPGIQALREEDKEDNDPKNVLRMKSAPHKSQDDGYLTRKLRWL